MLAKFDQDGVSFQYPGNWALEHETDDPDWVVTLQTPSTAVMMITYYADGPEPAELADETLEALQDDYPELDTEIALEKIAGLTAMGHDIDILTLDTPVVAKVRALQFGPATLTILQQMGEPDREHYESLFAAVTASIQLKTAE
jgi:hypothetical protein